MKKILGFQCNNCKSILWEETGECACKKLKLIHKEGSRYFHVYSNNDNFNSVYCFIDDTGRLIKYVDSMTFEIAPTAFVDDKLFENL
jgi:hypothetical protein